MIIKTFTGDSAVVALKKVREEMGGAAFVLKTRQVRTRGGRPLVEITACLNRPTVAQASSTLAGSAVTETPELVLPSSDRLPASTVATDRPLQNPSIVRPVNRFRAAPVEESVPTDQPEITVVEDRPIAETAVTSKIEKPVPIVTPGAAVVTEAKVPETPDWERRLANIERKLDDLLRLKFIKTQGEEQPDNLRVVQDRIATTDLPPDYRSNLMKRLAAIVEEDQDAVEIAHQLILADLNEMIAEAPTFEAGDRVVVLGPAGSAKSTVMGKLAGRLLTQNKKITLASLDDQKMAAHDEIASYADVLGVNIIAVPENNDRDDATISLIDTPAFPSDAIGQARLIDRIERVEANHRLVVFSALTRSDDVKVLAHKMKSLKPTGLIVTMMDLTSRYGAIMAATQTLDAKLLFTTDSPAGRGLLAAPDAEMISGALIGLEVASE
jgi:flagellar biosynthesis GTPase FlhF